MINKLIEGRLRFKIFEDLYVTGFFVFSHNPVRF